jgi:penicillin-binding protein 1A
LGAAFAAPWVPALPAAADEKLPTLQEVLGPLPGPPSVLIDEGGKRVGEIWGAKHVHVAPLRDVPPSLRQALIDTEDPSFYGNAGFDPRGIARALFKNLLAGKAKEGGSTLSQQLAKTLLGDRSRTLNRKVKEAWLTVQLEQQFTKLAILERYLNEVYWGHGAYGVAAASEVYFDKPVGQLSLTQAALLVAMLKGPSAYDPFDDESLRATVDRAGYVLDRMVENGHLRKPDADRAALRGDLALIDQKVASRRYSPARAATRIRRLLGMAPKEGKPGRWFKKRVSDVLIARHGAKAVQEGGLTVRVTMDSAIQKAAEEAAARGIAQNGRRYGFSQVAIVAVEPGSGKVRALVGGVGKTEYDRTMARLQPGSSFKPFVYLTAFAQGRSPEDHVQDKAVRFPAGPGRWYEPKNFDHKHRGDTTLRVALEQSINSVAVALLADVGIGPVVDTARRFGLVSPINPDLTLALGSSGMTPLEMATAYAGFANDGVWTQPVIYADVTGANGQALERPVPRQTRVFEPEPVRMLVSVMQGVIDRGTAHGNGIGRPAAGKTATTDRLQDAWFIGFTPQLCVAVWVGNDDRKPMRQGASGGRVAAHIWKDVMIAAHAGKPIVAFTPPLPPLPPAASASPVLSQAPSTSSPDFGRPAEYDR